MRYVYSMLRFVPDPARGEFVNIGAIVGSDESTEWELRLVQNNRRARSIDDRGSLSSVWARLNAISETIDKYTAALEERTDPPVEICEAWLKAMADEASNLIQLSPPAPIKSDSLDAAMDIVFSELIVDPDRVRSQFKQKVVASAAVRRAYQEYALRKGRDFIEQIDVRGRHHEERFDFAVANGRVVQLAQTFSFQRPDKQRLAEEIKAWAFTVEDIKRGGAKAVKEARASDVASDVAIAVVFVPPVHGDDDPTLREALSAFEQVGAMACPDTDARRVGMAAHDLLAKKG